MKNHTQDNAGVIALPPLIYAVPLTMGLILHIAFPIRFLPGVLPLILGWPLIAIALFVILWANQVMIRAGTNVNPYEPTVTIVTEGPYRFTRNPMYLSMTLLYGGISILINALWALLLLPAVLLVMHRGVIEREERYLEQKFGKEYVQYKARVRRWI